MTSTKRVGANRHLLHSFSRWERRQIPLYGSEQGVLGVVIQDGVNRYDQVASDEVDPVVACRRSRRLESFLRHRRCVLSRGCLRFLFFIGSFAKLNVLLSTAASQDACHRAAICFRMTSKASTQSVTPTARNRASTVRNWLPSRVGGIDSVRTVSEAIGTTIKTRRASRLSLSSAEPRRR